MIFKITLTFFIFLGFLACNETNRNSEHAKVDSCNLNTFNPNGDSELAILMREMVSLTDSVKQDLLLRREIRPMPGILNSLISAQKTDSSIDTAIYNFLAENYLARAKEFYSASEESKVENYNLMVGACVTCHQNFCAGPIKRINKLLLK